MSVEEKLPWRPLAVEHGFYDPLMVGSIDGTDDRPHDRAISRAIYSECGFPLRGVAVYIYIIYIYILYI